MTLMLTAIWFVGMLISGIVMVRVMIPKTLTQDFIVGLASLCWPIFLLCVSISIFSRAVWTQFIDRIIIAARTKQEQREGNQPEE